MVGPPRLDFRGFGYTMVQNLIDLEYSSYRSIHHLLTAIVSNIGGFHGEMRWQFEDMY